MKTCKTCGTAKPADAQHFRLETNRHGREYLRGDCLDCYREKAKRRMDARKKFDPDSVLGAKQKHRRSDKGKASKARHARESRAVRDGFVSHAERVERERRARAIRALKSAITKVASIKRNAEAAKAREGRPWLEPGIGDAEKYRRQYRLDPGFNLKERIRRQIRKAAKRDGVAELIRRAMLRNGSSSKVQHMLGYTIAQLRAHLERQFLIGMGWHNYGKWHIDHIIPQRMFDMSDEDQWRKCWCMSNLRPLWQRDNLAKSGHVHTLL